ncbi:MAG: hypothetical protein KJ550_02895 [Proteobacteria bacterium]|nr:hypothetical protein [Desulfobacteraceae bacterium]MBU4012393.1 hypothetical protein [Pseudomonadota bacterium]MBU4100552.1 hypothetical protein [Pseudomonadota bacterium]MBU4127490.1 hypothetical protein [Pseudomonadota bacterium]
MFKTIIVLGFVGYRSKEEEQTKIDAVPVCPNALPIGERAECFKRFFIFGARGESARKGGEKVRGAFAYF